MSAEQASPNALRYAAEEHVGLRGASVVGFDAEPEIDTTPTGGAWVAAWVWVPNELAAAAAKVIEENQE